MSTANTEGVVEVSDSQVDCSPSPAAAKTGENIGSPVSKHIDSRAPGIDAEIKAPQVIDPPQMIDTPAHGSQIGDSQQKDSQLNDSQIPSDDDGDTLHLGSPLKRRRLRELDLALEAFDRRRELDTPSPQTPPPGTPMGAQATACWVCSRVAC